MARVLSRPSGLAHREARILGGRRHQHTGRGALATLLEVDAAAPSTASAEGEAAATRRIEEALDLVMARMAEPDWAVFRPGTSYYVPPRPAGMARGLLTLLRGGGGGGMGLLLPGVLSADEARAIASGPRGFPSSTYFVDDRFPDEVERPKQDAVPAEQE